jgi:hypothetical protein
LLPDRQIVRVDRKRDVQRTGSVVRRDRAIGSDHRFQGLASGEQQEHRLAKRVCAHARVGVHGSELETTLIELARTLEVVDIEAGFENARDLRHA